MNLRIAWALTIALALSLSLSLAACGSDETTGTTVTAGSSGKLVKLEPDEILGVDLPENPSTGYRWAFKRKLDTAILKLYSTTFKPANAKPGVVGAGGTRTYRFRAVKAASTSLSLVYRRPSDPTHPARSFSLRVKVE